MVGIDLGYGKTALCWRERDGSPRTATLTTKKIISAGRSRMEMEITRLCDLAQAVVSQVVISGASVVAIEDYSYGSPNLAQTIAELGGAVRYALRVQLSVIPWTIPPKQARKIVFDDGGMQKKDVVAAVKAGLKIATEWSDDECDAWVMMRACEMALDMNRPGASPAQEKALWKLVVGE